uniref:FAD-binding domain-containing protein n=1 Tax=Fagus sylvatica TaxID=28930 RepID=A0A2N9FT98_FAGSY
MRCYFVRCEGGKDLKSNEKNGEGRKRPRILIAGGGIAGLVLALGAKHRDFEVKVFEKDLSAVRGEGRERGPIQLSSSALAVLQAIDENAAQQIIKAGHVTGNRINGFADGVSGECLSVRVHATRSGLGTLPSSGTSNLTFMRWFTKPDLFTPAVTRGLPITQVICRMALQEILVNAVGSEVVRNKSKVVDFREDPNKVRSKLFGVQEAKYSSYTCYSGVANFAPPYVDTVGYRVFPGLNQYFVALDVGNGKMQWYAFHKEPQRNTDPPRGNSCLL